MSAYITKIKKTYLKSTLSADATSVALREMLDSKNNEVEMSDFGDWAVIVVKSGEQIEMIKFDGLTRAVDGTVTLDVATDGRNIDPTFPYTSYSTGLAFQAGAEVIVTNDPLSVSQFVNSNNAYTWTQQQTFSAIPICAVVPTADNHLTNKKYVDDSVGALNTSIAGKVSKTGDEDIGGVKNFTTSPTFENELIIPEGVSNNSALTKLQVMQIATGDTPIVAGFKNASVTYNGDGTVNTVTDVDQSITYTMSYNNNGQIVSVNDGTITITITYDDAGNITQLTQS